MKEKIIIVIINTPYEEYAVVRKPNTKSNLGSNKAYSRSNPEPGKTTRPPLMPS